MNNGITIGQAAAFAGVTIKTVRHYHRIGLVAEPERDGSGYRRYGSAELLRLVQARTLAGAGVPLAEIGAILGTGPEEFADALVDVEVRLDARIAELTAQRATLRRLAGGDRALLPERAGEFLDRFEGHGATPEEMTMMREALVLVRALAPESLDEYIAILDRSAEDPAYVTLIRRSMEVAEWSADDPRIEELADEMAAYYIAHPDRLPVLRGLRGRPDGRVRNDLLHRHGLEKTASARLAALGQAKLRAAGIDVG